MAKVNKKPFHCIPLAAFTHNSHSTLSSKVTEMEDQDLHSHVKKVRRLIHHSGDQWSLYFARVPSSSSSRHLPHHSIFTSSVSPTDVPGGFSVSQREEAREGGDLQLTCVANKYLYTALSWQRVNGSPVLSGQQLTSGEFSNSQVLLLSNLTARDSGAYRCSVRHLITGQETHLDTQVLVTSEWSQLYDLPSTILK